MKRLTKNVETRLVQRVAMATKCSAWNAFSKDIQTNIMQLGLFDPLDVIATKEKAVMPRITSAQTKSSRIRTANSANGNTNGTNTGTPRTQTAQRRPFMTNARQTNAVAPASTNGRPQINFERTRQTSAVPKTATLNTSRNVRSSVARTQSTPNSHS